jgi:protein-S-isoprenylcysteine O-methyltransferase Ste14
VGDRVTSFIAALWAIWLIGWVLASRWGAETVARKSVGSHLAYAVFIWAGAVLLFVHPQRLAVFAQPLLPRSVWIAWAGVVLVALGLGFTVWARLHLGRMWSGTVTLKADHIVVRSGPYGLTRHPIYTGLLLALIGTVLVRRTLSDVAAFILFMVGLMIKIHQEERLLTEHLGDEYRAYQAEVPAVVPAFGSGRSLRRS